MIGPIGEREAAGRLGPAFSLFYFTDSPAEAAESRYRFLLETVRFGDENGFAAAWTPERHFHSFGGLYPNPAVLSAALAVTTRNIGIRAGSVVLPLHHPIRVCEDWSVVDNLSNGRVGISVASGWHEDDFVFAPDAYDDRRDVTFERLDLVRRLWRGEPVPVAGPGGRTIEPKLFPRPVQPELPVWVTSAGSPTTLERAGAAGANVLASLIGQSLDELAEGIARYRRAREAHGHDPDEGIATVMVHTYVHEDDEFVRRATSAPLRSYLAAYVRQFADVPGDGGGALDLETQLDFAYERYVRFASLIGTPDHCLTMSRRLVEAGADEIACLIDFGLDAETVLASLALVVELRERLAREARPPEVSARRE